MVQNLRRVRILSPPLRSSGGGTKKFSGASRPICPPPERNPVSATVHNTIHMYQFVKKILMAPDIQGYKRKVF